MSDHWNSLANLLGTPSVDPLQRKPTPAAPAPDKPKAKVESTSNSLLDELGTKPAEVKIPVLEPAAKPEPTSRIRASWDAVARMFGVAPAAEAAPIEALPVQESIAEPDEDLFAGFKKKSDRDRPARSSGEDFDAKRPERSSNRPAESLRSESVRSSRPESKDRLPEKGGKRKRPPSFWETNDDSASSVPVDKESPRDFPAEEAPVTESRSPQRDRFLEDDPGSGEPERRGRRRNIRRGREGAESNHSEGDTPQRREVRSQDDRPPPSERAHREGRSERDDPPPREDRSPRGERSDREPRRGRSGRASESPRSSQVGRDDTLGRREESVARSRSERQRPVDRDVDEIAEEPLFGPDEVGDSTAVSRADDDGKRRRRRRGRRRGSKEDIRSDREEESLDDIAGRQAYGQHMSDDEEADDVTWDRLTKITSWVDAISPMIDSNMENHKKNTGHDHRGRGGRSGGANRGHRRRGGHSSRHD